MDEIIQALEPAEADELSTRMEGYFSSIEDAFDIEYASESRTKGPGTFDLFDSLAMISAVCLAGSVLPLIPLALWSIFHWGFPRLVVLVYGWGLPVHSFLLWWPVCMVFFGTSLVTWIALDTRKSRRKEDQTLSRAAMRFAYCYATTTELERFSKNRIPRHVERAAGYWNHLLRTMGALLNPFDYQLARYRLYANPEMTVLMSPQAPGEPIVSDGRIAMPFPWFRVTPATEKILVGLNSLPLKVTDRIKDKKDLPHVARALKDLAGYLYTVIPEVSSDAIGEGRTVADLGEPCLLRFSLELGKLSRYRAEPRRLEGKQKLFAKLTATLASVSCVFGHENLLIRFLIWWFSIQSLVLISVLMIAHYMPSIKVDTVMLTFILGTPLLVSAGALAGVGRKR